MRIIIWSSKFGKCIISLSDNIIIKYVLFTQKLIFFTDHSLASKYSFACTKKLVPISSTLLEKNTETVVWKKFIRRNQQFK